MKYRRILASLGVLAVAACSETSTPSQPSVEGLTPQANSTALAGSRTHVMSLRGTTPSGGVSGQATGINYHGGPILTQTNVATIYWANSTIYNGGPAPGTNGAGSADGSLVGYFLNHLGGSPYFNINTTYFDQVGGGHTVANVVTTRSTGPTTPMCRPATAPLSATPTIQAEIIAGFTNGKPDLRSRDHLRRVHHREHQPGWRIRQPVLRLPWPFHLELRQPRTDLRGAALGAAVSHRLQQQHAPRPMATPPPTG